MRILKPILAVTILNALSGAPATAATQEIYALMYCERGMCHPPDNGMKLYQSLSECQQIAALQNSQKDTPLIWKCFKKSIAQWEPT